MSDDLPPNDPGTDPGGDPGGERADHETLAAEFALGLLEGAERATAMRLMLADPDFAASVARWRAHFATLFEVWPETAAPANGLARIEQALRPLAANDAAPTLGLWQAIAGLSSLVAAGLIVVLALRPGDAPGPAPVQIAARAPVLVASIIPVKEGTPVAAAYDPASATLRVAAAALSDEGHSAELWVIAKDGVPQSLGLLGVTSRTESKVAGPTQRRLTEGSTLAVTIEPIGGAPGGKPTGPVVATGLLILI